MKISEHIHKIREFYVKDHNPWGQGSLLNYEGGYCLLGAAASVVTNKHAIDSNSSLGEFATLGDWRALSDIKGEAEVVVFEGFFMENTTKMEDGSPITVVDWNDQPNRTRSDILTKLRNLEAQALELGV